MEIVTTDEFAAWFQALGDSAAEDVTRAVNVLAAMGADCPRLSVVEVPIPLARRRPTPNVQELVVHDTPYRVLLSLDRGADPTALLLYGYSIEEGRRPSVATAFEVPNVRRLAHLMLAVRVYWLHQMEQKEAV